MLEDEIFKNNKDNTISNLSVHSILQEFSNESSGSNNNNEMDFSLEEILAEFSSNKKSLNEAVSPKKAIQKPVEHQGSEKEKPIYEELKKPKPAPVNIKNEIDVKKKNLTQEDNLSDIKESSEMPTPLDEKIELHERPKPKLIKNIVRPWEDGYYENPKDTKQKSIMNKPNKIEPDLEYKNKAYKSEFLDSEYQSNFKNKKVEEKTFNIPTETAEDYIKRTFPIFKRRGFRALIIFLLCLPLCYISFASQHGWYFPNAIKYINYPNRFLFLIILIQSLIMLSAVDVIANGFKKLILLKADYESTISFASLTSLLHTFTVMLKPDWGGWLPYSSVTCLSLFFCVYGIYLRDKARIRACKAASAVRIPVGVFVSDGFGRTMAFKQSATDTCEFTDHIEDMDGAERFSQFLAPLSIVASLAFASVASFGAGAPKNFFWSLAAISSVSAPFFSTLSFSLPFMIITKHLSGIGAALTGWYSTYLPSRKMGVIIKDTDLFPKGTIILHGLKMLGNQPLEKTLTYAASIIDESDSGLSAVFSDLLKNQFGNTEKVTNLRYHETGGIEADVHGDNVLLGTAGFMLRMGIRVHESVNVKNAVFVAINMELSGVFNVNYKVNTEVRRGLTSMIRRKITPVLAAVDFNLTPIMLETEFKLPVGSIDYPEVEDRIDLASDNKITNKAPFAIVTRAGLYPYASSVLSSRRLRKVTIRNIILTTACIMIGMMLMFYLTFTQSPESALPYNVFLYQILWMIPMYLLSARVCRY